MRGLLRRKRPPGRPGGSQVREKGGPAGAAELLRRLCERRAGSGARPLELSACNRQASLRKRSERASEEDARTYLHRCAQTCTKVYMRALVVHEHETRHDGARAGPQAQRHTTLNRHTDVGSRCSDHSVHPVPRTRDGRRTDRTRRTRRHAPRTRVRRSTHSHLHARYLDSPRDPLSVSLSRYSSTSSLSLSLSLRIPAPASLQTSLRGHADAALLPHAHTCMPCAWCCERPHPAHALGAAPGCTPRGGA